MDLCLLSAAISGDLEKIKQLEKDVEKKIYDQTTPEGKTVLHMAASFGHMPVVYHIVEQYPSLVLKSSLKGQTPLHMAARAGELAVVESFIKSMENLSGIYIARMRDIYGNTPMHGAVRNGHRAVVRILADYDKESLLLINNAGESPLSIAIDMRFTELEKEIIILDERTLEFIGHNGQTALHLAILRYDYYITDIILRKNVSVEVRDEGRIPLVKVQDERKRTPLHYAAALVNQKVVENLLSKDFSVSYMGDNNYQIPLHLAAKYGPKSLIKTLLDYCPDTIEMVDNKQRTILHLAAETGNLEVVLYILKLAKTEYFLNSRDVDGNTPLHLASKNYYIDVVDVLSKNPWLEIRATNNFNQTALEIVKLPDSRGMELQQYLTLKVLKSAYEQRALDPDDILENPLLYDIDVEKASSDGIQGQERDVENKREDINENGRRMAKMVSLMSTLIATFTFTAAFTMPGGFKDNGPDEGMATLIRRSAFQAFVVFDALAMTLSITSAAIILISSVSIRDSEMFLDILSSAIALTWTSFVAVILAFVTGLFAVLQQKLWLAILVCGTSCFVLLYFYAIPSLMSYGRNSKSGRNDIPFFLIFRMVKMFFANQISHCLGSRFERSCPCFPFFLIVRLMGYFVQSRIRWLKYRCKRSCLC